MRFQIETIRPQRLLLLNPSWLGKVAESVRVVLATPSGSIPSNREFGLDMTFMHLPENAAKSAYASAAADAIERYVPGIRVNQIIFEEGESPDALNPVIEVTDNE